MHTHTAYLMCILCIILVLYCKIMFWLETGQNKIKYVMIDVNILVNTIISTYSMINNIL